MAGNKSGQWPDIPLKVRVLIAARTFVAKVSLRPDGTINRYLMDLVDPKSPPNSTSINGLDSFDITVDASRNLWFRLYVPCSSSSAAAATLPLIVYFHGGGFALSAANSKRYDLLSRHLADRTPAVVVSVNYRRSPEHRYPSPYDDGLDTLKFIENGSVLPSNTDLSRCFIAGDSAGGNIAHHVALRAGKQSFNKLKISGLIAVQPFFGGEERTESELRMVGAPILSLETTDWMWKAFPTAGSDRNHEAANVSGPNSADISAARFPATLLFIGGYDPLQDWQRRYYDWLKRCGKEVELVEYPNAFHGFYAFPDMPESSMFIMEAKDFILKQSSK